MGFRPKKRANTRPSRRRPRICRSVTIPSGADSAGAHVERSAAKRRNDGAGRRSTAFRARSFGCTPPPTRLEFTGRSEAEEEADRVTDRNLRRAGARCAARSYVGWPDRDKWKNKNRRPGITLGFENCFIGLSFHFFTASRDVSVNSWFEERPGRMLPSEPSSFRSKSTSHSPTIPALRRAAG